MRPTRINRGQSHENGVAEHAHYRLKDAIDQALILRGNRDFHTADDYADFVRQLVEKRNRLVRGKLEQLRPLPPAPVPALVRKPGAFARYRFREQLFPTRQFRLAYDALKQWRGERADVEYVRILHLAAQTMATTVDSALSLLLETCQPFDYAEVGDLAEPRPPAAPALVLTGTPDLKIYDSLLTGSLAGSGVCG